MFELHSRRFRTLGVTRNLIGPHFGSRNWLNNWGKSVFNLGHEYSFWFWAVAEGGLFGGGCTNSSERLEKYIYSENCPLLSAKPNKTSRILRKILECCDCLSWSME